MKPLPLFGFAIALSFLAPLAQAAPAPAALPEPAHVEAPAPPASDHTFAPVLPPVAEQPHRAPDANPTPDAPDHHPRQVREGGHDRNQPAPDITIATAPDTDQGSAPAVDDQDIQPTDCSCGDAATIPTAHYTMDDLTNAMQDLDSSY
ncbi:MAG TPA: hypothetical protein VHY09_00510 [Candidatus Methylacidiphilales bacterium]|nr:hypothetical protein [Candidatus Methylacidiphilales bacterium]